MQHQPEFPFDHHPQRITPPPGLNQPANPPQFMPDARLAGFIQQMEHLPESACYPIQANFYETLMGCDLLLPIPHGTELLDQLPLMSLENEAGESCLPLFTNENNLCQWSDEPVDYLVLPFETLCAFALQARLDYVVINVCGPYGCEIPFHNFSYLAEGLIPPPGPTQSDPTEAKKPGEILIAQQTPMRLGLCPEFSQPLLSRLQELFQHHESLIETVYLFSIAFHQGPLQPALGIHMPQEKERLWEAELWPNLQAILHEMLEKRDIVNVFLLNEATSLEPHISELTPPIFHNEKTKGH